MNPQLWPLGGAAAGFGLIALYTAVTGRRRPRTPRHRSTAAQPGDDDTDRALIGILAATWDREHPPAKGPTTP